MLTLDNEFLGFLGALFSGDIFLNIPDWDRTGGTLLAWIIVGIIVLFVLGLLLYVLFKRGK
jgi:heme/copper-type cytochrome/quinol oxidase subunit 2